MLTDLRIFLNDQPFVVRASKQFDFTPGGSTGSDLMVKFRAEFGSRGRYNLRFVFSEVSSDSALSGKGLEIGVVDKANADAPVIPGKLQRDGTLLVEGLHVDREYVFVEGLAVPTARRPDPNVLSAHAAAPSRSLRGE